MSDDLHVEPASLRHVGTEEQRGARRAFWIVSLVYAIPISFVATLLSTIVFMQVAVALSTEVGVPDNYLSAFFSSIFIALLVYLGFCYLIVPATTLIVGMVRLRRRRRNHH